jgi:hypothetical protein
MVAMDSERISTVQIRLSRDIPLQHIFRPMSGFLSKGITV